MDRDSAGTNFDFQRVVMRWIASYSERYPIPTEADHGIKSL